MPSHRLILEKSPKAGEWLLEWDATTLSVKDPDGKLAFDIPIASAHRIVELYDLDTEGKVSFRTDAGSMTFKRNKDAARDVRALVLEGLRSDTAYREGQKRQARISIPLGITAFFICGALFAVYCSWASVSGDPPKDSTTYKVLLYGGWLIHLVLLGLLGGALAGPYLILMSLRQLRRVRQVERTLAEPPAA